MLKLDCIPPKTAKILANLHYTALNKIVKSGKRKGLYYTDSVIYKLDEAIAGHTGVEKQFFEFLKGPSYFRLKAILCGSPTLLDAIIKDFHKKFPGLSFKHKNAQNRTVLTPFGVKVSKVFNYDNYRRSSHCIDILRSFGIGFTQPCPYCNCDALSIIEINSATPTKSTEMALLDLDHFFSQKSYPFLAVSLFNLVPSCRSCNSNFKGAQLFELHTHVNPFLHSFDDLFTFKLAKPYLDGQTPNDLEIKYIRKNGSTFPDNSIKDLKLIERYEPHRHHLITMLEYLNKKPYEAMIAFFPANVVADHKRSFYNMGQIPMTRKEIALCTIGKLKVDIHDEHLAINTL